MKIVFLDVDGVLNSHAWFADHGHERGHLDPEACARMQRLCDETGARIVVSSTWRLLHKTEALRSMFKARGLTAHVIGGTPALSTRKRGDEIQRWLDGASIFPIRPTGMVIIDDDGGMEHLTPWWVKTHFDRGFTDWELGKAVETLARPMPERLAAPEGAKR